jgi:hypothetical protein
MGKYQGMLHLGLENKAKIIALIMVIVALLTPYMFSYSYDAFDDIYVITMISLTWIHWSNVIPFFIFPPFLLLSNPINTLLRLWFVFEIYRCYIRKSTIHRALYVGVVSELWQLSIMIYQLYWGLLFGVVTIASVPIPLLLIAGAIILKVVKLPKPLGLWTEKENESKSTDDFLSE